MGFDVIKHLPFTLLLDERKVSTRLRHALEFYFAKPIDQITLTEICSINAVVFKSQKSVGATTIKELTEDCQYISEKFNVPVDCLRITVVKSRPEATVIQATKQYPCEDADGTYWVNDQWYINPNGSLKSHNPDFVLYRKDLANSDWLRYLQTLDWVDFNKFIPAYFEALKRAGIKKINVLICY